MPRSARSRRFGVQGSAEVVTMNLMWLILLAAVLLILWAGWKLSRRSPSQPGDAERPRNDGPGYDQGGGF